MICNIFIHIVYEVVLKKESKYTFIQNEPFKAHKHPL